MKLRLALLALVFLPVTLAALSLINAALRVAGRVAL